MIRNGIEKYLWFLWHKHLVGNVMRLLVDNGVRHVLVLNVMVVMTMVIVVIILIVQQMMPMMMPVIIIVVVSHLERDARQTQPGQLHLDSGGLRRDDQHQECEHRYQQ